MKHSYATKGICPKRIKFEIDDGLIHGISFDGGCPGNLRALSILSEGRDAVEIANLLSDVKCGSKNTSCPAQLAKAIIKSVSPKSDRKKKSG